MGWKKIITSLSNAVLNSLTTTGNVSASGNLYADLPSNEVNNGLVVVQDPDTGKLFKTGSYGGGGGGSNVNFNVGGTTGTLTNLNITDFAGDVHTSLDGGNLTITFGTPAQPSAGATSVTGFEPDRFNQEVDDYIITWSYNLNGTTFDEGQLQRAEIGTNNYTDIYSFSNGTYQVSVNSSTLSDYRIGSHKFRIKLKTILANGESSGWKYGGSTEVELDKTDPGQAYFSISVNLTSGGNSGTAVDRGSEGTVTFSNAGGASNGWNHLGYNSSTSSPNGASALGNINKTINQTNSPSSGTRVKWWDDGGLNNPERQKHSSYAGSIYRIRSFRFGITTNSSFTTDQLRDLDNFPPNGTGTIRYGKNTKNEIQDLTFSVNPSGHRIYIIYDSSLGNLDGNSGIQDVNSNNEPVGDNFSSTTEDGYKIYMTTNSDGEYSPFTLRVRFA